MNIGDISESLAILVIGVGMFIKKSIEWYKTFKGKKVSKIEVTTKKLEKIYEKIIECRLYFDSCRVSINQFHNGDHYYSQNSILKMSMTHETTDESTAKILSTYQNVLASRYPTFIKKLSTEDVIIYKNISETDNTDDDMILDLKMNGTEEMYVAKLTNSNGNIIGFLCLSFCDKCKKPIDTKKFKEFANLISFILRN